MYAGERFNSITHIVGSVLAIIAGLYAIYLFYLGLFLGNALVEFLKLFSDTRSKTSV